MPDRNARQTETQLRAGRRPSPLFFLAVALVALSLGGCSVDGARVLPESAQSAVPESPAPASAPSAPATQTGEDASEPDSGVDTAESAAVPVSEATVVRVVDGDTAVFKLKNGRTEKTRFIGIDTPESTNSIEEYGQQATAFTKQSLPKGRTVYLELGVDKRDRYDRLLAYVWLSPPGDESKSEVRQKMFNAELALGGYAQQMTVPPNSKYASYFREFVAEARDDNRGLWAIEPAAKDR